MDLPSGREATPSVAFRLSGTSLREGLSRLAMIVSVAIAVGYGVSNVVWALSDWTAVDVDAYWNAALRLRESQPLYPAFPDVNEPEVYRYAPWFAFAWIPLTFLPRAAVDVLWSVALVGASIAVVAPLVLTRRVEALVLAGLLGSFLLLVASVGNVQPLLIASLVWGLDRRSGPLWIAIAASLKATPLAFVFVYVARREWKRAAATLLLTALLTAPLLAFDLSRYTVDPGETFSLITVSPLAFVAVGAATILVTAVAAWRRSRWTTLAAAVAAVMCLPRVFPYLDTFLLVGTRPGPNTGTASHSE
jgi:hypothetical protein